MDKPVFNPIKIKRRRRIVLTLVLMLFLTPLWMFLLWYFQKDKPIKIIIIDKTVSDLPRQEHRGYNWILTYNRYTKPDNELYNIYENYYGFFPIPPLEPIENRKFEIHDFENFTFEQLDSVCNVTDMIYFTDNYGVYRNEWYLDTLETEHSPKVYGGLTEKEVYMAKNLKSQSKLIISEFNTFCSPTPSGIRNEFEKAFGLKWTQWTCRYFDCLDTILNPELPRWVIRLYKQQHNNEYPFHKAGLVYVHENSTLFILENETHLNIETPFIHTPEKYQEIYDLPDSIHYPFWFDITFSEDSTNTNSVVSKYKIYPNQKGDSLLEVYGVPKISDAVVEHLKPYTFYYFAGDYIDNPVHNYTSYLKGIRTFDYFLYNNELNDRTMFFWKFYIPLVSKIMDDYYEKLESKN